MGDKSLDSQLAQEGRSTLAKRVRNPNMGSSLVPLADNLTNSGCCCCLSSSIWCKFDELLTELESSAIVSCCRCFSDDSAMTDVVDVLRTVEPIYSSNYVCVSTTTSCVCKGTSVGDENYCPCALRSSSFDQYRNFCAGCQRRDIIG